MQQTKYAVFEVIPYEGDDLIAIFDKKEDANRCRIKLDQKRRGVVKEILGYTPNSKQYVLRDVVVYSSFQEWEQSQKDKQ